MKTFGESLSLFAVRDFLVERIKVRERISAHHTARLKQQKNNGRC